jgi:hypothetical protein
MLHVFGLRVQLVKRCAIFAPLRWTVVVDNRQRGSAARFVRAGYRTCRCCDVALLLLTLAVPVPHATPPARNWQPRMVVRRRAFTLPPAGRYPTPLASQTAKMPHKINKGSSRNKTGPGSARLRNGECRAQGLAGCCLLVAAEAGTPPHGLHVPMHCRCLVTAGRNGWHHDNNKSKWQAELASCCQRLSHSWHPSNDRGEQLLGRQAKPLTIALPHPHSLHPCCSRRSVHPGGGHGRCGARCSGACQEVSSSRPAAYNTGGFGSPSQQGDRRADLGSAWQRMTGQPLATWTCLHNDASVESSWPRYPGVAFRITPHGTSPTEQRTNCARRSVDPLSQSRSTPFHRPASPHRTHARSPCLPPQW